jgi:hypothetical protein
MSRSPETNLSPLIVRGADHCGARVRLWAWSPIRAHPESRSTPRTFTRTSSPACANMERTGICRRHCRHGSWPPCQRLCTAARWSSATFRHAVAAPGPDWPGRGEGLSDHKIDAGSQTQVVLWMSNTAALQTRTASNTGAATPMFQHSADDTRKDLPSVRLIDWDAGPWSRARRGRTTLLLPRSLST